MFSERIFQITFLLSLIAHGIILFQNPNFSLFPALKKEETLEVSYLKIPQGKEEYKKASPLKNEPFLKIPSKITLQKIAPPPFVDKESIFKEGRQPVLPQPVFNKPAFIKPDIIAIKKKITLPPIDIEKIKNPSYINYYQIVREKIRRAAYQNYLREEEGEVYLSFIIADNGPLKDVRILGDKSSNSTYLKDVALRSIQAASPFPAFPKELDYPQLSFNVVISFEIE